MNAKRTVSKKRQLDALRSESDRADRERIRARLALPVDKRMNFLRMRLPGGGSCL